MCAVVAVSSLACDCRMQVGEGGGGEGSRRLTLLCGLPWLGPLPSLAAGAPSTPGPSRHEAPATLACLSNYLPGKLVPANSMLVTE